MSDRMLGNIGTASESKRVTTHGIINNIVEGKEVKSMLEMLIEMLLENDNILTREKDV